MENKRVDKETADQVREAILMQRAFGEDAGRKFLALRQVPEELSARVLDHPGRRRQN